MALDVWEVLLIMLNKLALVSFNLGRQSSGAGNNLFAKDDFCGELCSHSCVRSLREKPSMCEASNLSRVGSKLKVHQRRSVVEELVEEIVIVAEEKVGGVSANGGRRGDGCCGDGGGGGERGSDRGGGDDNGGRGRRTWCGSGNGGGEGGDSSIGDDGSDNDGDSSDRRDRNDCGGQQQMGRGEG
ncbi:uncharacterized protein LOC129892607 [Solanum dulcamara]|uniref:uncharacterized protein LOC129892607 n=1 Tax=Solanum dulcamara TaxID=45834 RepID=UPI002485693F|nr:uncharacterized protein LOC129892607 [Solanum dulcamara]